MKNSKRWVMSTLSLVLITIALFGFCTYYFDPLLQYGKESNKFTYWESSEIYSNPGIAKNYDYDTVLVGSSMVENTDVDECNKLLNCNMIKVPYSGGSSYNHKTILDVCFTANKNIKSVYWSLDEYALETDYKTPRYPLPDYLYDFNKTNDLSYLLNLDVFYFYTTKNIMNTMRHMEQKAMRGGSWAEDTSIYNKNNMLSTVDYPKTIITSKGKLYYEENLDKNLKYNILPLVKDNTNTQFKFYMVPYSIAYWYNSKCNGTLEAEIYNAKEALSQLTKLNNVTVYFFQDEKEIITNLDNYKDYSHFSPKINSYMTKCMSENKNIITADDYNVVLDDFYDYLNNFDYEAFFENAS